MRSTPRRHRLRFPAAFALRLVTAGTFILTPASATAQATVTVLPPYTGSRDPTYISGGSGALNTRGQVAGWSYVGIQARGGLTGPDAGGPLALVPAPAGTQLMYLNGVSENGRAAGYASLAGDDALRTVYYDGTTSRVLAAYPGARDTYATDVNDAGRVVGNGSVGLLRGFVSGPDGGPLVALGTLGGSTSSAEAINNAGRVVGSAGDAANVTRATYWDLTAGGSYGGPVAIGGLGSAFSRASAISESGGVAGNVSVGSMTVPFFWSGIAGQDPTFIDLLSSLGTSAGGIGRGVNSLGQVVGVQGGIIPGGYRNRAFIWDAAAGTRALDELVSGWTFSDARAINDRGQILAYGERTGTGFEQWVLVSTTPVPEPGTWALLGSGLLFTGAAARARGRRRRAAPHVVRAADGVAARAAVARSCYLLPLKKSVRSGWSPPR